MCIFSPGLPWSLVLPGKSSNKCTDSEKDKKEAASQPSGSRNSGRGSPASVAMAAESPSANESEGEESRGRGPQVQFSNSQMVSKDNR